jgi:hypothetical protein
MAANYEPPSRRVSRESLGDWTLEDVLAHRALLAGITEAELIHALLQDRKRLMDQLRECLATTPPSPILIDRQGPTADADLAAACREWMKGCTCAPANRPQECQQCTATFLDAVLSRAKKHGLQIGANAIEQTDAWTWTPNPSRHHPLPHYKP